MSLNDAVLASAPWTHRRYEDGRSCDEVVDQGRDVLASVGVRSLPQA